MIDLLLVLTAVGFAGGVVGIVAAYVVGLMGEFMRAFSDWE